MNEFVLGRVLPATGQGLVALVVAFALTRIFRRLPADSQAWIWRLAIGRFLLALVWEWPVAVLPGKVIPSSSGPASSTAAVSLVERTATASQSAPVNVIGVHPVAMSDPVGSRTLSSSPGVDWTPISWVWAIGTGAVLVIGLYRWLQLYRIARRGQAVSTRVRVSDEATVPFLVGNVIVLPAEMPEESREIALAHEMAHRIRRDPFYSLPNFTVSALFWFVLPVWLALREYAIQVEIDCDRRALRLAGVSPRHYGSMLVALATRSTPPVGAATMSGPPTALSRRLTAMKNIHRPRTFTTLALTLAAGALVLTPVRPVSAAAPLVQSAEVKQNLEKVERAQRELANAIASLNRAVKKSNNKFTLTVAQQRQAALGRSLDALKYHQVEIRAKALPVLTMPRMSDPAAERARVLDLIQSSDDWANRKQILDALKVQESGKLLPSRGGMAAEAKARSLQDRIQQLEYELENLKKSVSDPKAVGATLPPADFARDVAEKMAADAPVAGSARGGAPVAVDEAYIAAAKAGAVASPGVADAAFVAAVQAGAIDKNLYRVQDLLPRRKGELRADEAIKALDASKLPPAGLTVPPVDAAVAIGAPPVPDPKALALPNPVATNGRMVISAQSLEMARRQRDQAKTIQIAVGKNGTITLVEGGKTRTLRVDPKTRSVQVNHYTIIIDNKKAADGSCIIRLIHD